MLYYEELETNYSKGLITFAQYFCFKSFENLWRKQGKRNATMYELSKGAPNA